MSQTLNITDLPSSEILDRKACAEVKGRGDWHLLQLLRQHRRVERLLARCTTNYVGTTFHDGYLSRHVFRRLVTSATRTQTEYSYWDHFVRV